MHQRFSCWCIIMSNSCINGFFMIIRKTIVNLEEGLVPLKIINTFVYWTSRWSIIRILARCLLQLLLWLYIILRSSLDRFDWLFRILLLFDFSCLALIWLSRPLLAPATCGWISILLRMKDELVVSIGCWWRFLAWTLFRPLVMPGWCILNSLYCISFTFRLLAVVWFLKRFYFLWSEVLQGFVDNPDRITCINLFTLILSILSLCPAHLILIVSIIQWVNIFCKSLGFLRTTSATLVNRFPSSE